MVNLTPEQRNAMALLAQLEKGGPHALQEFIAKAATHTSQTLAIVRNILKDNPDGPHAKDAREIVEDIVSSRQGPR